jgi:hypothetical protein
MRRPGDPDGFQDRKKPTLGPNSVHTVISVLGARQPALRWFQPGIVYAARRDRLRAWVNSLIISLL